MTRTKGWLKPKLTNGQPKYLPEDVHAVFCRLRDGEVPDDFHDCMGRGKPRPATVTPKATPQQSSPSEKPTPTPAQFMSLSPLKANKIRHRRQRRWRIIVRKDWAIVLNCKAGSRKIFKTSAEAAAFIQTANQRLAEFSKGNGNFTDLQFAAFRVALSMVNGDAEKLLEAVKQYNKSESTGKLSRKPRRAKVVARHFLKKKILNRTLHKDTIPTMRYEVRKFVETFGDRIFSDITHDELQIWVRRLKLQPKGIKNVFGTVKQIFDHGVKLRLRNDNPTAGVELEKINQSAPERFKVEQ